MTLSILGLRTTDPVVFDDKLDQLQAKSTPADRKCAIKKELMAAMPFVDEARKKLLADYIEKNGSPKDKRRLRRKTMPKNP